jgi:hypothetical protein
MKRQGFGLADVELKKDENDQAGRYQNLQRYFQYSAKIPRHRCFS